MPPFRERGTQQGRDFRLDGRQTAKDEIVNNDKGNRSFGEKGRHDGMRWTRWESTTVPRLGNEMGL